MAIVLRIIGLILAWGPLVLSAVRNIEVLLSDQSGDKKKAAALDLVKEGLSTRGVELSDGNLAIISGMIDFIVAVLNAWKQWRLSK